MFDFLKKEKAEKIEGKPTTTLTETFEKLDSLIGENNEHSENVIWSDSMILLDIKVFYKNQDRYDFFRNVGRISRDPGTLKIGVYNREKGFFDNNIIPLVKLDRLEGNFRPVKRKFNPKKQQNR